MSLQVEDIRTGGNVFRLRQMTMHAPGEHKFGSAIPRLEVRGESAIALIRTIAVSRYTKHAPVCF